MNRAETKHQGERVELLHHVSQLESFTNQVKRREVLQRTRKKINNFLEKRKHETEEMWSHYYKEFSEEDWARIFSGGGHGLEHNIKNLLMYGSS